eukprot:8467346-Heterocapsa_arctica.AAC.1
MFDNELDDEHNVVKDLCPELKALILGMPPVAVHKNNVNDVKSDEFEEMREEMEAQLQELCNQFE